MADDTPNDSAPDAEDMQGGTQEPVSGAEEVTDGELPAAEASTAVAVADEPESIPEPSASDLALAQINEEADRVQAALDRWMAAERDAKAAKEDAKEAEADWKAAVAQQQRVIKGLREELPLFDRPYFEAKQKIAETAKEIAAEKDRPADESWRQVRLDTLSIPSSTVELLAESDIHTIGDISNLQLKRLALTDVRGVGPAKAKRVEDALIEFWAKNPNYSRPEPPKAKGKGKSKAEPEPDDEPREDREVAFEPPADEFDPNSDSQSTHGDDEEGQPEPDEMDLDEDEPQDDDSED